MLHYEINLNLYITHWQKLSRYVYGIIHTNKKVLNQIDINIAHFTKNQNVFFRIFFSQKLMYQLEIVNLCTNNVSNPIKQSNAVLN